MPRACSAALLAKIAWRHVGGPTTGRMPIPASLAMVERGEAATEAAIRELDTCAASKASTATALKLQARPSLEPASNPALATWRTASG